MYIKGYHHIPSSMEVCNMGPLSTLPNLPGSTANRKETLVPKSYFSCKRSQGVERSLFTLILLILNEALHLVQKPVHGTCHLAGV